jgi:exonuclease I
MTKEKLKSLFLFYYDFLREIAPTVKMRRFEGTLANQPIYTFRTDQRIAHLLFMCQEARTFVETDRVEKAMRWLGFLQGALWSHGYCTLDELRQHSMPDKGA